MVDLNQELRTTLLDSGVTISDDLANQIISWGIGFIEQNVGVPLEGRDTITEQEQAQIEAWFAVPENALAYGVAFSQQPFYPAYLDALLNAQPVDPVDPVNPDPQPPTNPVTPPMVDPVPQATIDAWLSAAAKLYNGLLGLAPDTVLLQQWAARYVGQLELDDLASEFLQQASLPDVASDPQVWLEALYEGILGRTAEADGLAYWQAQLASVSSAEVALALAQSGEASERFASLEASVASFVAARGENGLTVGESVAALYQALLGRVAETEGLAYWEAQLNGQDDSDALGALIELFLASDEFTERNLANDDDFVSALYVGLLQRSPESAEVNYWATLLEEGTARSEIVEAVVESAEFVGLQAMDDAELA